MEFSANYNHRPSSVAASPVTATAPDREYFPTTTTNFDQFYYELGLTPEKYDELFQQIPDLAEAFEYTPFALSIVRPTLEKIAAEGDEFSKSVHCSKNSDPDPAQTYVLRKRIYKELTRRRFDQCQKNGVSLSEHCRTYARNLAGAMLRSGSYSVTEQQTLDIDLKFPLPFTESTTETSREELTNYLKDFCFLVCSPARTGAYGALTVFSTIPSFGTSVHLSNSS